MSEKAKAWVKKIAEANKTTPEKVLEYLAALSRGGKVIHHLNLEG